MKTFSEKIIFWYNQNKRDLPWRNTQNPYLIWLSEIILQQTRVEQGREYYNRFAKEFPTVKKLAGASEDKVLKLWQGLGYYSRARNLHASAKIIAEKYNGKFPETYQEILQLKGVGDYTASAISSFAFGEAQPVLDGNVFRVLARVFGIDKAIDSTIGKKYFRETAFLLLDKKNAGKYNQAIMEFGALQCKPQNPDCKNCVLNSMCFAYENKAQQQFPVKEKNTKQRNRYFNYFVFKYKDSIVLRKRSGKDIWKNLYDFPLLESDSEISEKLFFENPSLKNYFSELKISNKYLVLKVSVIHKHILSHQKIYARFWEIELKKGISESIQKKNNFISIPEKKISKYAIPRLIDIYLKGTKN
ncbi:MAG TPA: A/G-specific adenine glycosylase [Bacteroidia bacterium]|nr:A/G-specific adenine glycosylase [Bacteroidia bacterium]